MREHKMWGAKGEGTKYGAQSTEVHNVGNAGGAKYGGSKNRGTEYEAQSVPNQIGPSIYLETVEIMSILLEKY